MSSRIVTVLGGLLGVALFAALVFAGPMAESGGPFWARADPEPTEPEPPPRLDPAPPEALRVPSLQIAATITEVALGEDRQLLPPRSPERVGWWDRSAQPGADHGGTVIAGHTVHTGGGALDDLHAVEPGAIVVVRTANGRVRYRVDEARQYTKAELAADAEEIFDQAGPARLVLVTCDDWNGREYLSNVVVFATPFEVVPALDRAEEGAADGATGGATVGVARGTAAG